MGASQQQLLQEASHQLSFPFVAFVEVSGGAGEFLPGSVSPALLQCGYFLSWLPFLSQGKSESLGGPERGPWLS